MVVVALPPPPPPTCEEERGAGAKLPPARIAEALITFDDAIGSADSSARLIPAMGADDAFADAATAVRAGLEWDAARCATATLPLAAAAVAAVAAAATGAAAVELESVDSVKDLLMSWVGGVGAFPPAGIAYGMAPLTYTGCWADIQGYP